MRQLRGRLERRAYGGLVAAVAVLLSSACQDTKPVPGTKDTAVTVTPPPESVVVPRPPVVTWDSTAGPALFIAGQSPSEATVVVATYTDSASLDTARFDLARLKTLQLDLFAGGRRAATARVQAIAQPSGPDSCRGWPVARLAPTVTDSVAFQGWAVAFESGHAVEIALDSIEGISAGDSSRFAADVARLASGLPGDTAAMFRGLPFVVKKAWRSRGLNPQILVAVAVRNVNQEASPRQERLLIVAERDTTTPTARYQPVYHERVTGLEETIETTDPIAMVLLGAERRPTIVVTRDASAGASYALVERINGRWQRRWVSAHTGC